MAHILIENLTVYYKQKKDYLVALDRVSLEIPPGSLTVLTGPSGCGKTTLLKTLADQAAYMEGRILLDGVPIEDISPAERGIAYVAQEYSLYPSMTVFDNLAYPLRRMGASYEETETRVKEMAEKLEISFLLSRKPRQLSGGQQQRVAIGRALIRRPRILLFDEPFSQLEPQMAKRLRELVQTIHREQKVTVLFATHNLAEARLLAEQAVVLKDGEIRQTGTVQQLDTAPADEFVREFWSLSWLKS